MELNKRKGKDFRILQLTDLHIGGGFLSKKSDALVLECARILVKALKPDFIAVTGDALYPFPLRSGTFNNMLSAVIFADLMEEAGVPWGFCFGNHDCEKSAACTKDRIADYFTSKIHCLFKKGTAKTGIGNYMIPLKNADGSLNTALFFLDSNMYVRGLPTLNYDIIHEDQTEWYAKTVLELSALEGRTVPSLMFFHIPLIEFREAFNEYRLNPKHKDVKYHFGEVLEKNQRIYSSKLKSGLFDKILELGSTKGIFVGHDHLNNISLTYKGVRMA